MGAARLMVALVAVVLEVVGPRGCLACVPPDCERPDCGTCGVACCRLELNFPSTNHIELMTRLNTSLAVGGPDGRFTLRPTAESPWGFGDLRPYHGDTVSFIGQAFHLTSKKTYTDTINLLIKAPEKDGSTTLVAHSISQIGGAYCDAGQNYKNIAVLLNQLEVPYDEVNNDGCPDTSLLQLES